MTLLWRTGFALPLALAVLIGLTPTAVLAQKETQRALVWDITRGVLLDPTTYFPAAISYEAKRRDWQTGQVLFDHGWLEQNPDYTISGLANDVPLSYAAGKRVIRKQALGTLQLSVVNNFTAGALERLLIARHPSHRKLIRALSWVERISFAGYISYLSSVEHFRQAARNRRLAREHGFN